MGRSRTGVPAFKDAVWDENRIPVQRNGYIKLVLYEEREIIVHFYHGKSETYVWDELHFNPGIGGGTWMIFKQ